ncbi:hypothetical protein M1843_12200 [Isoptericola sp. 4D.3]|uniref:Uncharacterized protein n=1 Tax=Isoptericola peretonis TaxID=2918523 RepID=A0ABT0J4V8_9MICO|nr:hypothetical protein [Isoptericola sp. 4D.3]
MTVMTMQAQGAAPAARDGGRRVRAARRVAGFGAAGSIGLYVLVKSLWVLGGLTGLLPDELDVGRVEWVVLNVMTLGMGALGIALGLALAQPWGMRLPGVLVVGSAWLGAGFLVSMLPHTALTALLVHGGRAEGMAEEAVRPFWDTVLITVGFAGMALGLLVATPLYFAERWPHTIGGTVGGNVAVTVRLLVLASSALVPAAMWTYWAVGGSQGLDAGTAGSRAPDVWLLDYVSAGWALLGVVSAAVLSLRRPRGLRRRVPVTVGFIASGSLFAWNAWRVPWVTLGEVGPMRSWPFALVEHGVAMVAGVAMLLVVLRSAAAAQPSTASRRAPVSHRS